MGSNSGELVFEPATLTVPRSEAVTFVNNKAFPHNVVFTTVPAGVDPDALGSEALLNGPGDSVTVKFPEPGVYEYECEVHSGMQGTVIVK